jgi:hypothetical protein
VVGLSLQLHVTLGEDDVSDPKTLAPELVALVHHVELSKAGWWNIAIQKLLFTAFHLHTDGLTLSISEIREILDSRYSLDLEDSTISEQLTILVSNGEVFEPESGRFKASEKALQACESEIAAAVSLEASVKSRFRDLLLKHCPTADPDLSWSYFIDRFLVPLVSQMGANTYHLLTGSKSFERLPQISDFVECFDPTMAEGLDRFLREFLDPTEAPLRRFVLRTMNAFFVVRAGGLNKTTVDKLAHSAEAFKATLFCDSNVLFSLLGLHDNPADESSRTLLRLVHRLSKSMPISLRVLPPTLDEMKRAIKASQEAVINMRVSPSLLQPAVNAGLKGITVRYLELSAERKGTVAPADYFEPYLKNLVTILRDNGVELFNKDLATYKTSQDVIDDLLAGIDFEKQRYGPAAKNYERLEHDVVMWHFVDDQRPLRPDSPIDAKYWIVTADYRFLGYDAFKRRGQFGEIPICLHPIAVIQLLQFWVPMDSDFEAALFSAIRLPTVLVPFDGDAEKISLQILNALSTFANISDMPPETTTRILLNDALRQKLALQKEITEQIDLVREALIEENRQADERLRSEVAKNRQMEQQSKNAESQLSNSLQDLESLKLQLAQAQKSVSLSREAERAAMEREEATALNLQRLNQVIEQGESKSQQMRQRRSRALFGTLYAGALAAIIGGVLYWHSLITRHVFTSSITATVALVAWASFFGWWGSSNGAIQDWAPFKLLIRVKMWLFLAIIAGVIGNAAWALIGKATANENKSPSSSGSQHVSSQTNPNSVPADRR